MIRGNEFCTEEEVCRCVVIVDSCCLCATGDENGGVAGGRGCDKER